MPDGSQLHQKNWLVPDAGGEFVSMSLTESGGPKAVTRCGIAATDANGADLATALSKDVSLGMPVKTAAGDPQNATSVWWDVKLGPQSGRVMLSYQIPGTPGAVVDVIYHKAATSPP